jgi:flagellar biosynthesis protein FlhF
MKIKTYVVDRLKDAYPAIYQDLGKDAVILKTKPVKAPGFFGLLGRKKIEVVAASDLASQQMAASVEVEPVEKEPAESKAVSGSISQEDVLKELFEMKGLIQSLAKGEPIISGFPVQLEKWIERFREQEVDEDVIQYLLKRVKMKYEEFDQIPDEEIEQSLFEVITQLFAEGIAKETTEQPFLTTLVGPTGVGKTTTIAKLAAARVLQGRKRIGLLTADTYRIGAIEQLKTYGNILNVPLQVVASPDGLQKAISELKGCQMIFMDSAGRNYLEDEYVEDINKFLNYDAPQENFLVLSMTTRWRDMRKIIDKMKSVPIDKMILTKWDETTTYGAALNLLYHYPYPLAYLSIGQGVPQDIMAANAEYMTKLVMGVEDHAARPSL